MRLCTFLSFTALVTVVTARLPVLARCNTLDLGAIPCEHGAVCTAVNTTYSQCLPTRTAGRDARAARRGLLDGLFGVGAQANLVNGTPYTWKLTSTQSVQMNDWSWPKEIAPFSVASVYVEFNTATSVAKDAGNASYALDGTKYTFSVQARADGQDSYRVQINLDGLSTFGNDVGSVIPLGWRDNGYINWVLAGKDENSFVSSNPPPNWIQRSLDTFGDVTLGKFVMPGSHDAGMYKIDGHTAGSRECNTLTQTQSIGKQLETGARYFDIRPVIAGGKFKTGHYSEIKAVVINSFQGGNGQSIDEVVNDVNEFTKDKAEVVVLRLSHDLNTDVGNSKYRALNQDELNQLFAELQKINDLYTAPTPDADLTQLTLNQLTANGTRSAVMLIFRLDGEDVTLGDFQGKGFFQLSQLNAYNEYSDSDDLGEMAADQLKKMNDQKDNYFLLSWTLTQSALGTLLCPVKSSILELAQHAIGALYTQLIPAISKDVYPKLLYIDNFVHTDMVAFAMAINYRAIS